MCVLLLNIYRLLKPTCLCPKDFQDTMTIEWLIGKKIKGLANDIRD